MLNNQNNKHRKNGQMCFTCCLDFFSSSGLLLSLNSESSPWLTGRVDSRLWNRHFMFRDIWLQAVSSNYYRSTWHDRNSLNMLRFDIQLKMYANLYVRRVNERDMARAERVIKSLPWFQECILNVSVQRRGFQSSSQHIHLCCYTQTKWCTTG